MGSAGRGDGLRRTVFATELDRTTVDPTHIGEPNRDDRELDRTVPSIRSPYGQLAGGAAEPEGETALTPEDDEPTSRFDDEDSLVSDAKTRQ